VNCPLHRAPWALPPPTSPLSMRRLPGSPHGMSLDSPCRTRVSPLPLALAKAPTSTTSPHTTPRWVAPQRHTGNPWQLLVHGNHLPTVSALNRRPSRPRRTSRVRRPSWMRPRRASPPSCRHISVVIPPTATRTSRTVRFASTTSPAMPPHRACRLRRLLPGGLALRRRLPPTYSTAWPHRSLIPTGASQRTPVRRLAHTATPLRPTQCLRRLSSRPLQPWPPLLCLPRCAGVPRPLPLHRQLPFGDSPLFALSSSGLLLASLTTLQDSRSPPPLLLSRSDPRAPLRESSCRASPVY